MVRPSAERTPLRPSQAGGIGRTDQAMNVLQYGTAILAIVVVTLLGLVR
jgi:hypothetical protein